MTNRKRAANTRLDDTNLALSASQLIYSLGSPNSAVEPAGLHPVLLKCSFINKDMFRTPEREVVGNVPPHS